MPIKVRGKDDILGGMFVEKDGVAGQIHGKEGQRRNSENKRHFKQK